jgi:nucleotide-binding universal stress UspA family protein
MYDTILVPLDGSPQAEAALPHVQALARPFQSAVILLRVFELPILAARPDRAGDDFAALPHITDERLRQSLEEATAYLERQAAGLRAAGLTCSTRVAYGPVAATIMNTAVAEDVDLIAMASHGAGNLQGVYYGSVAAGVLQRVDRPLLIVRAHAD